MNRASSLLTPELAALLPTARWMIRQSDSGRGYAGFVWAPKGEWTTCPRWKKNSGKKPDCDNGGLFGQSPLASGHMSQGNRIELCETDEQFAVGDDKVKTARARIVAIDGEIPPEFFAAVPNLALDLSGCDLKGITLPTSVGGWLDLSGCDLKGITLPTSVGGWLYLRGCDLKGITLPKGVKVIK